MPGQKQNAGTQERMYWLDNLRTFMVFLVVVLHAGLVYESSGIAGYFWIVDDPSTNDISGLVNLILDIFVMPTIFLISGFLTPLSLEKRTWLAFVKSRFRRLMVPWIIAVLTLLPIYKVIFLYSRNLPQEHWSSYFHWSNGIWGQNWLWFLPILFLFDILYLLVSRTHIDTSKITLKKAIPLVFLSSFAYSVAIDLAGLQGWTKTILLDFQNDRLFIYFMIFLAGVLCHRENIFASRRKSRALFAIAACTAWIPVNVYLILVIYPLINSGNRIFSWAADTVIMRLAFLLSLLSLLYLAVETFRRYLNRQGRLLRELGRNSYNVYIVHTVVMGGIALLLLNTSISSLMKHFLLAVFTYATSSLIVYVYRSVGRQIISIGRALYDHGQSSLRRTSSS
jgi:peptidoglycan/LPS O-acetylase OafA/YrhL